MTISESVKNITFKGLESFDCSKILGFISEEDKWHHNMRFWHNAIVVFMWTLVDNAKYVIKASKGKTRNLFAYSDPKNSRADVYQMLWDVYDCSKDASFIELKKICRPRSPKEVVFLLFYYKDWWKKLKANTTLDVRQRMATICALMKAVLVCKRLAPFTGYKNVVVYYDAMPMDNVPAQFFMSRGGKSATLQHGLMCASKNVPYYGIWFRCFVSDYFLAWNNLTKEEAIKDGVPGDKIRVCGIAKCINACKVLSPHNKILGVLLDGYDFINKRLIEVSTDYCRVNGFKYVLRYHPNYKGNEYDNVIDKELYIGEFNGSLYDYAMSVEFTLMGNSTALMELLYMGHPTYVLSTGSDVEIYPKFIPVIHNTAELELLLNKPSYIDEVYEKLVSVQDIRREYTEFFDFF